MPKADIAPGVQGNISIIKLLGCCANALVEKPMNLFTSFKPGFLQAVQVMLHGFWCEG